MNLQQALALVAQEFGLKVNFTVVMLTMALLLARILPVIILTPVFGGEVVPTEVKMGLGLAIGLVLFPALSSRMAFIPTAALPFLALLLKEVFFGLSLAFIVGAVFYAAEVAGGLIDTLAGTSMAQVMVPQQQHQASLFSSFSLQLTVMLFLTLNGHQKVIQAFADSLGALPLDQYPQFREGQWAFFELVVRSFVRLMAVGFALASPALLAAVLTDLGLGMINRVAPQVQVFFVSMQIKPAVTVVVILTSLYLMLDKLKDEFVLLFGILGDALRLLA